MTSPIRCRGVNEILADQPTRSSTEAGIRRPRAPGAKARGAQDLAAGTGFDQPASRRLQAAVGNGVRHPLLLRMSKTSPMSARPRSWYLREARNSRAAGAAVGRVAPCPLIGVTAQNGSGVAERAPATQQG